MNKTYNVAKHDIYLRIKIVSLYEMYGSHRFADSGLGFEIVSSDDTASRPSRPESNFLHIHFAGN